MFNETQRRFIETRRVGHLATADAGGAPYLVPVCFGLHEATLYITIDEKPKRRDVPMKRVRNIIENPRFAFIVDHYDEDWTRLGWVMLRGKYRQYLSMNLSGLPVIALRIAHVVSWGDLSAD